MTFGKQEDGLYHWEYRGGYVKGSCRNLWLSCWITMGILLLIFLICAVLMRDVFGTVMFLCAAFELGIFLLFFLIWLPVRLMKHTYRYTASEKMLSPFGTMHYTTKFNIRFSQVTKLRQLRDRNIIEVSAAAAPVPVVVSDEDYDTVWAFLLERCPGSATESTLPGGQTVRTEMSSERKQGNRGAALIVYGILAAMIGFGLSVLWGVHGPRIKEFTGTAQATIINASSFRSGSKTHWRYDLLTEIDGREYPLKVNNSSRKYSVGTVLPITYNVNDPTEFVLSRTPEAAAQSSFLTGCAAIVLLLTGVLSMAGGAALMRKAS